MKLETEKIPVSSILVPSLHMDIRIRALLNMHRTSSFYMHIRLHLRVRILLRCAGTILCFLYYRNRRLPLIDSGSVR